jgi:UDP-N-acetylmuramoyl-tripeptide--D-alanyl-D-alanine ligase
VDAAAPVLHVADTLAGLHALGGFARARFTGRLAAITGSVGKTSTKEMLRAMLATQGRVHAADASHNNHWGVPLTLARLPPGADFCVVEIGMNHAGEIAPLSRLARPHVALITAIGSAHIGHLGSLAAIAAEKLSIAQGLEPQGVLILPEDRLALCDPALPPRWIGFGAGAGEARFDDLVLDATGSRFTARVGGRHFAVRLGVPGRHMALDALAGLTAAAALGADPQTAAAALAEFAGLAGRGARMPIAAADGAALLLDESYNASVDSVVAALAVLGVQPGRRRLAVLGDMLELGEAGEAEHRGLAPHVIAHADLCFACGPLTQALFEALPAPLRAAHAPDSAALAPLVAAAVRAGDVVLVKGSLGSRMRLVVEALTREVP